MTKGRQFLVRQFLVRYEVSRRLRPVRQYFQWLWLAYICAISIILFYFIPYTMEFSVVGRVMDQTYLLRRQNLSLYIRPNESTHLTEIFRNEFNISQQLKNSKDILIFVCSDVRHRSRRKVIRATWGRKLRPRPIFILGKGSNLIDNDMAIEEAKIFGDVIIEDFMDTYQNLTLKTVFALKHFLRLTPEAKYFFKIDDDVLLNTYNLDHVMYKFRDCKGVFGSKEPIRYVHRDKESKWHVPKWMYTPDKFPVFVNGPAYLISGSIVYQIYKTALATPLLTLEDVFVTGIVAHNILNYTLFDSWGFQNQPFFSLFRTDCFYR